MLSKKCQYAIRAVLYLAVNSSIDKKLIGGRELSEALDIPLAFTLKILQELARVNIITSMKGPGGGFYLTEENSRKPVFEIVKTMCDPTYFTSCGLGLKECSEAHPCPIHGAFKESREILLEALNSKTIGQFKKEIEDSKVFLVF